MSLAFVPGFPATSPRFLGRFLSPVADGVAAHYVRARTLPGELILDPFGQSPNVSVESLSLNRRVIVATSNPILRLALSLAVRPPALADLKAALTALGDARIGPGPNERLEVQIKAMYVTTCAKCHTPTTADTLEWEADANEPVAKHYVCLECGGPRDALADDNDQTLARRFARAGPDYHFLLGRTDPPDDSEHGRSEDTLAVYPPRTLAAIAILVHKLESLELDRETRRLLAGLLVAAFDATTTLAQERPKVLSVARRYREVNVWFALENAVGLLAGLPGPDPSSTLEGLLARSTGPAIYVHAGPMRDLAARLPAALAKLVLTAPPRPNQAFWTLSATWAAWLWGLDSAEAFRGSLRRRRYDWNWHARALHQSMAAAQPALAPGGRLVCLMAEAEPGFNASVLSGASGAGYHLREGCLRGDTAEAQLEFEPDRLTRPPAPQPELLRAARDAIAAALRARAEPSHWISVHFAAWSQISVHHLAAWDANDPLTPINHALQQIAAEKSTFLHWNAGGGDDPASGLWYLSSTPSDAPALAASSRPLADRVEAGVQQSLARGEPIDEDDLLNDIYGAFPGVLTPGRALVMACLASYGTKSEDGHWQLRREDTREVRASELQSIQAQLRVLAGRSGFEVGNANPQEWRDGDQVVYIFVVLTSALISHYLLTPQPPARHRFLVLPGGRAGLVEYKLRRDPRLRQALSDNSWTIVKFRRVRQMLADVSVTRATLEPALAEDPLEAQQQLALLERGVR